MSDQVALEIIRSAFFATVRQAGRIILRSSFSPIIRDAFDFCVTLIGPEDLEHGLAHDVVAMNESLAHFSGVMPFMVRNLLWEYGVENLRPGDMLAVNNPFKGGNHVYDLKAGGVSLATTGGHIDDIKSKLDELKKGIEDGSIKVPSA